MTKPTPIRKPASEWPSAAAPAAAAPRVLVCPPTHFGVEYVINPWMVGNIGAASAERARRQWDALVAILAERAELRAIAPRPGMPDMCFTANGGFALAGRFVPATFAVSQRAPEAPRYRDWADDAGMEILDIGADYAFEGEGDALWWPRPGGPLLVAGYGVRSDLEAHRALAAALGVEVVSLRLVDRRFYHLDTCFLPFPNGACAYYPAAFDERSRQVLATLTTAEQRIEVAAEDAEAFACNAVVLADTVIANAASTALRERLAHWNYDVVTTPLTEFMKAGGAAKCLTLLLDQRSPPNFEAPAAPASPIRAQTVALEGHLLDAGVLARAIDVGDSAGGSVRLERFRAGARRDQPSQARLAVAAPDGDMLAAILDQLETGVVAGGQATFRVADAAQDCVLLPAPRDGVAPEDFCCSTIYPTDLRLRGRWVRAEAQRMDAAIVVEERDGAPAARCVLPRELRAGDAVVCGETGVRVHTPAVRAAGEDFAFMSSGASSERRVQGQVEELALEMRRVRSRGGRIVVVAGPVVVHTGGAPHLAGLIRDGFVQALLAGNALAVHDLETSLYGTSLGVDLRRGAGVRGGHRHHLRTINRVRAAGSIAAAVAAGVIGTGVMYECVRAQVPFVLAGSIRDDGPLPETEMDLLKAQAAYAREIAGADLILMLATMLHAIGVGNMTPAGVRLVCVDINPAVVTKLADRGSVESTGIVTDVGLFLEFLAMRLGAAPVAASGA